ncbi:hypothetical protein CNI02640 [Cryptococcus deneoformans JEC21]|uniref:Protein BIG1 n=1 Tax=Cryptococcus deneoformans (strain JEC21 / ATCC MYA-565) TaxID=214684 RepID=Q5KBG3_CRYD1|nr:hypothetical protein CNI02640 [Cryptococcus neoformans var. neoformans JEC21]AAW45377.1 hypothetical protein CNI02640 [Cryptococcus neoformans var. neoformans JEC21]
MRPPRPLALLALALPAAAFRDTSPLLIWLPHAPHAPLAPPLADAAAVYSQLHTLGCDWHSAVAVHVDDLHSSCTADYAIPPDAHVHIPYLSRPDRRALDDSLEAWARTCGAVVDDAVDAAVGGKRLVRLSVANGEPIPPLPPSSILLITGSPSGSRPHKRQEERPFPTHSSLTTRPTASPPKHNATVPADGPLFDRVQILTTPIITALLVTFGIFIPLAAFGVSALASIQVPPRMMEIGKGLVVGKERKDQ